jgi:Flp pilus assembly CpaF family ATPase
MPELSLYVFLVVAGDRNGVSWYGYDRICSMLRMDLNLYLEARNALIDKDLIAFDGSRFQVLSLPEKPVGEKSRILKTAQDMASRDPAAIRNLIHLSLEEGK